MRQLATIWQLLKHENTIWICNLLSNTDSNSVYLMNEFQVKIVGFLEIQAEALAKKLNKGIASSSRQTETRSEPSKWPTEGPSEGSVNALPWSREGERGRGRESASEPVRKSKPGGGLRGKQALVACRRQSQTDTRSVHFE